jgi:hypothetical protein
MKGGFIPSTKYISLLRTLPSEEYRAQTIVFNLLQVLKSFKLLSAGEFGFTFSVEINFDVNPEYIMWWFYTSPCGVLPNDDKYAIDCFRPVSKFVFKIAFITDYATDNDTEYENPILLSHDAYYNSKSGFIEESKIQYEINNKTTDLVGIEVVAPSLSSLPCFINNTITFYDHMITLIKSACKEQIDNKGRYSKKARAFMAILTAHPGITLGIIPMGLASGCRTLHEIEDDYRKGEIDVKDYIKGILLGKFAHLQLFECGYYHGDPHGGNILINLDEPVPYSLYDDNGRPIQTGKTYLIDFGRTHRIDPTKYKQYSNTEALLLSQGLHTQYPLRYTEYLKNYVFSEGIPLDFQYYEGYHWLLTTEIAGMQFPDLKLLQMMVNFSNFVREHEKNISHHDAKVTIYAPKLEHSLKAFLGRTTSGSGMNMRGGRFQSNLKRCSLKRRSKRKQTHRKVRR